MKEDITQLGLHVFADIIGCGLVMKEDITQLYVRVTYARHVVVW